MTTLRTVASARIRQRPSIPIWGIQLKIRSWVESTTYQ